jgi:hypothetical protein
VAQGKDWKQILPKQFNIENFFRTIFFQGKVTRDPFVGVFHSMIFYGFVTLFIATEFVAIQFDTPFKIFTGTPYKIVSLIADVGGFFVLVGIALAYYRRYVKRPKYLSATNPKQEMFMYAMLVTLVVVGYLLEGIRIMANNFPEIEKPGLLLDIF